MKQVLFILLVFGLFSCNEQPANSEEKKSVTGLDSLSESEREAVRQMITYSGVVPCADCESIEVIINLFDDNSFEKRSLYSGRKSTGPGSNEIVENGTWMMHGDTLHLVEVSAGPNRYIRTDSSIIQLDMDGNKISGALADKYVLKRVN
jgi:hypothetical protein